MKRSHHLFTRLLSILITIFLACGVLPVHAAIVEVQLKDGIDNYSLKAGDTMESPFVFIDDGEPAEEETSWWYYSDTPEVASVNETTGEITGLAYGYAYIHVTNEYGTDLACIVRVYSQDPERIWINEGKTFIAGWEDNCVYLHMDPVSSRYIWTTYTSSNPEVASVIDERTNISCCYLETLKAGTTVITARTDSGLETSTTITVLEGNYAASMTCDWELYLKVGETIPNTVTLEGPTGDFSDDTISYVVEDLEIISVDPETGDVTGLKEGDTYLSVIGAKGELGALEVHVSDDVRNIRFENDYEYGLLKDGTKAVHIQLQPASSSYENITFTSSDPEIASIDSYDGNGTCYLNLHQTGAATITAETPNGLSAVMTLEVFEGNYASQAWGSIDQNLTIGEITTAGIELDGPTGDYSDDEITFESMIRIV